MSGAEENIYEFGEFRVEAGKRVLLRGGEHVPLTPKVFETLLHLVRHQGEVLDKEDLMRAIWPDTIVEENNLNQNISTLRRVLGENRGENRYIVTVPGKGYRFIAGVETVGGKMQAGAEKVSERLTLAVLPFENLSADAEREYLADGLTEETIASLGQMDAERLSVIGRTSVMTYKRTTKTLAEIGRELDAAYLLEGSVRAEGGRLRITAKLIRAKDQVQIWSSSYDGEPSSLLTFQREMSTAIAEQIRLRLSPERLNALERRQTRNAEAYDLYLRGRHVWHQMKPPTTKRAIEYFARATQVDPKYALAWSGIADATTASPINGDVSTSAVGPMAREAVANAIGAEPELAEAQTSLGFLKFWFEWDWPAAEAAYRKAIALDANYHMAHRMLGILLSHMNRPEEARPAIRRARELEPLLAISQALSAQVAFAGRDYPAAVEFARQAIVVDPQFWIGHFQLAQVEAYLGNSEVAFEALNEAGRTSGGNSKVIGLRGYLCAKLGREGEALAALQTLESVARERFVPPYAMALIHAGLGQRDAAMEWLERAYAVRDVHIIFLSIDPKWNEFRGDARFMSLLERCGIAEYSLPG